MPANYSMFPMTDALPKYQAEHGMPNYPPKDYEGMPQSHSQSNLINNGFPETECKILSVCAVLLFP